MAVKLKNSNRAKIVMPYIKKWKVEKLVIQFAQIGNLLQLPLIRVFLHSYFVTRFLFSCFENFAVTIRRNLTDDLLLVKRENPHLLLVGGRRHLRSILEENAKRKMRHFECDLLEISGVDFKFRNSQKR